MDYKFPVIEQLRDVLPFIEGRDEFVVGQRRGDLTVINYNVGLTDTFRINENEYLEYRGENLPVGIMRRECRGLVFDGTGKIVSRPFHKFFNVNEIEETRIENLDMNVPHTITEKMDGSMVRPLMIHNDLKLGTKMVMSDVADAATAYLMSRPRNIRCDLIEFFLYCIHQLNITPIMEFISPHNRIVLNYPTWDLVLLAMRHINTGEYLPVTGPNSPANLIAGTLTIVPHHRSIDENMNEWVERQSELEQREGDVITFDNGHKIKVKNTWYVQIHRCKDQIRSNRRLLEVIIDNNLDDILPFLDENDLKMVHTFRKTFEFSLHEWIDRLNIAADTCIEQANGDRKKLAVEILPATKLVSKTEYRYIFGCFDGKSIFDMAMEHVRMSLSNTNKYNALAARLNLPVDIIPNQNF